MFELIDPPGAFDPPKLWREFLARMQAKPNRQEDHVQSAIRTGRHGLARAEALEKETRKRLALEKELRKRPA